MIIAFFIINILIVLLIIFVFGLLFSKKYSILVLYVYRFSGVSLQRFHKV